MKTIDLEGTVMQPRTSSSDIEWGTPNHPLTQIFETQKNMFMKHPKSAQTPRVGAYWDPARPR